MNFSILYKPFAIFEEVVVQQAQCIAVIYLLPFALLWRMVSTTLRLCAWQASFRRPKERILILFLQPKTENRKPTLQSLPSLFQNSKSGKKIKFLLYESKHISANINIENIANTKNMNLKNVFRGFASQISFSALGIKRWYISSINGLNQNISSILNEYY